MDLVASLPAFVVAVVLISASPGPAMALIMRRAALRGFGGAVPTVLGLEAGLYLWALFAAAGLAAMVAASEAAFVVLRVIGAGFLIYLGIKAWRAAWRGRKPGSVQAATEGPLSDPKRGWWRAFGEGALVMLANPKAAVFMIAFYPQFVPADRPLFATTAILALLQVAVEIVVYLGLAALVGRAGAWFRRPAIRRRLEAVSGTVLIALGIRVAAATRRPPWPLSLSGQDRHQDGEAADQEHDSPEHAVRRPLAGALWQPAKWLGRLVPRGRYGHSVAAVWPQLWRGPGWRLSHDAVPSNGVMVRCSDVGPGEATGAGRWSRPVVEAAHRPPRAIGGGRRCSVTRPRFPEIRILT